MNIANNLTTSAEGYALDARQGKALKNQMDTINSNLSSFCMVKQYNTINSNEAIPGFGEFDIHFSPANIPGYFIAGILEYSTAHNELVVASINAKSIVGKNASSTSMKISSYAYIKVLYIKQL